MLGVVWVGDDWPGGEADCPGDGAPHDLTLTPVEADGCECEFFGLEQFGGDESDDGGAVVAGEFGGVEFRAAGGWGFRGGKGGNVHGVPLGGLLVVVGVDGAAGIDVFAHADAFGPGYGPDVGKREAFAVCFKVQGA